MLDEAGVGEVVVAESGAAVSDGGEAAIGGGVVVGGAVLWGRRGRRRSQRPTFVTLEGIAAAIKHAGKGGLRGGISLNNPITFHSRPSSAASQVGIQNLSGNNTLSGIITLTTGGSGYNIQPDA